jgi:WD40 repeat protein
MLEANLALGFGARHLAVGKPDGELEIWDTVTWDRVAQWRASTSQRKLMEFSKDDRLLAEVGAERMLSVWDVASRRQIARVGPVAAWNNSLAVFSPDNQLLATVAEDSSVQLWRLNPTALLRTLRGQRQNVWVAFSPDGGSLGVASADASLKLWNLASGRVTLLPRALMAYYCVAFSPDGRRLAAAGPDPVVRIIDVTTGEEVASLAKGRAFTRSVLFTPDGNNLLALDDKGLTVWRAAPWTEIDAAEKAQARAGR